MTHAAPGNPSAKAGAAGGLADLIRDGYEWLPIGVLMVDADGAIVLVNRAFERLSGHGAPELIGQPIEVLVPEATPVLHAALQTARRSHPRAEARSRRELLARRKDGSEIPVEVGLTPLRSVTGSSCSPRSSTSPSGDAARSSCRRRSPSGSISNRLSSSWRRNSSTYPPEDVDRTIEDALGRLVRVLHFDRSALFQLVEATGEFIHTHQWTRPGWPLPQPRISANEQFPWQLSQIREGELVSFSSVAEVPGPVDREGLRRLERNRASPCHS